MTTHNNYISKIFYIEEEDKVLMYEQNMKIFRVYEAESMKLVIDVTCKATILAIEYISDRGLVVVSLCDLSLVFYDIKNIIKAASTKRSVIV